MIAAITQSEQPALRSVDPLHRSILQAHDRAAARPATTPQPSHLQAIHADKRGVILKGQRHETFWEW